MNFSILLVENTTLRLCLLFCYVVPHKNIVAEVSYKSAEEDWSQSAKVVRAKNGRRLKLVDIRSWMVEQDEVGNAVDVSALDKWKSHYLSSHSDSRIEQVPLPPGRKHHGFLSHYQKNGGDVCYIMHKELEDLGLKVWYDMATESQLTASVMEEGVINSVVLIVFLTKGVLTRPFVQLEVRTAIREGVPILLVHDEDRRRDSYADIYEIKNESPADLQFLFDQVESLPLRRRRHEARAFYAEVTRRILQEAEALLHTSNPQQ